MSVAVSLLKADDFLAVAITKPHCVVMGACRRDCLLYHYSSDEKGCPYLGWEGKGREGKGKSYNHTCTYTCTYSIVLPMVLVEGTQ